MTATDAPTSEAPTPAPTSSSPGPGAAPLRPAKQRTGAGPIGWVGPLLALLLTCLGLVLLRDGIFAPAGTSTTGWPAHQRSWLAGATQPFDGLTRAGWMVPVGIVLALVGLYLLVVALRRRTRRAVSLTGASGAYLLPADVARRASAAASDVDGVLDARASATRSKVTVKTTTTAAGEDRQAVQDQVAAAVSQSLAALATPPRVTVRATSTDGPSHSKDLA